MQKFALAFAITSIARVCLAADTTNPVIEWNRILLQLVRTPGVQPATIHATRSMAMLHTAIYEAVNSIDGAHAPYRQQIPVLIPGASLDAAADAAAFGVLSALYPSQNSLLQSSYENLLAIVPDGDAKNEGVRIGSVAASEILSLRNNDHSADAPPTITLGSAPGQYQSTPPDNPKPAFTGWSNVDPFALTNSSQFRPGPPPALTSQEYADAFNEVKAKGVPRSPSATIDQQLTGWFWNGAIQNYWNEIAQTTAVMKQLNTVDTARLFASLDVALADTVIAFYDAKYTYFFWRPITAIRAADTDDNPDTAADPNWMPETVRTAADPSYPGAHAAISSAAATVLSNFLGSDALSFGVTSEVFAGVRRDFTSFSSAAQEATDSRVFAGQHFRFDLTAGQQIGASVGSFVMSNLFLPTAF